MLTLPLSAPSGLAFGQSVPPCHGVAQRSRVLSHPTLRLRDRLSGRLEAVEQPNILQVGGGQREILCAKRGGISAVCGTASCHTQDLATDSATLLSGAGMNVRNNCSYGFLSKNLEHFWDGTDSKHLGEFGMEELFKTPNVPAEGGTEPPLKESLFVRLKLLRIISAICWLFALTKLFFFDFDVFLLQRYAPRFLWVVQFKIVWLMLGVAIFALFAKRLFWRLLYILLFPIILIVWIIPHLLWKQKSWVLVIAIANTIISAFTNWRYQALSRSLYFLGVMGIVFTGNNIVLWISLTSLLITLVAEYAYRFIQVFRRSAVYRAHLKIFSKVAGFGKRCAVLDPT